MRIFLCAGEPSGDVHGANLIRELQRLHPDIECVGFGGEGMEAAGCRLLYPLCRLAVMWFVRVLLQAHVFFDLLAKAERYFDRHRPDAVVLIDYPGFNWLLAKRAHARGIPVFYFIPPQLWGWAGWRVHKMRRWVDHVLCTLPFEKAWYAARGVEAHYIGHPYFDELAVQQADAGFLAAQQARPGPIIALLPGSRNQEIERNLDTIVHTAEKIHANRPEVRFLMACLRPDQQQHIATKLRDCRLPLEIHAGRTTEIIRLAHACVAVSGSVGLELLYHGKPSVVVYRIRRRDTILVRLLKTSRYISLVNLLADRELFPEFLGAQSEAEAMSGHILRWLNDPWAYGDVRTALADLRRRVAEPGACGRAARHLMQTVNPESRRAA